MKRSLLQGRESSSPSIKATVRATIPTVCHFCFSFFSLFAREYLNIFWCLALGSSKSSGHLTSLVYRKSIVEKKFLQIREFVEKKEIFEKEGVSFHFGNFGMSLNA